MRAIWPEMLFVIAVHPFVGVVVLYGLLLTVPKLLNCPIAAPKVPRLGTVTGIPTKCGLVLAPTVMTLSAIPGDSTVAGPGPAFPAAIATITPASTALLTAVTSGSFGTGPPPRLRLRTSIPSATAALTAAAISMDDASVTLPGKTL